MATSVQTFEIFDTKTGADLGFYLSEDMAMFATGIIKDTDYVSVWHSPSCYCPSQVHLTAAPARTLSPCYCDSVYHPKGC